MTALYISAAHKSSGKTMLSTCICAALKNLGHSVQPFKKGPDYIDPVWLGLASGKPCHNLDFFTSSAGFIRSQFHNYTANNDVALVEGNKGLHDGLSLDGSDSNAALARLLNLPVVLVLDSVGITRGIASLLNGLQAFDPGVRIAGVILNKVAGNRHGAKLVEAVETYTDIPVFGVVGRDRSLALVERHLGLIPGNEIGEEAERFIQNLQARVSDEVDLEKILACELTEADDIKLEFSKKPEQCGLRIAIARDRNFGFYYPADLDRFAEHGATLVDFDTSIDAALPENIDALFMGGGFPETKLNVISSNRSLLADIKDKLKNGLPAYAECGGLMYLSRSIRYNEVTLPMAEVIPADVIMHSKPQGRGYVQLESTPAHPWVETRKPASLNAHEFHYSTLANLPPDTRFAYRVKRGQGIDGENDGIIIGNLLASYCHLRQTDTCDWVDRFVNFILHCKNTCHDDHHKQERRRSN
ncbi:MAG: cobyrinate a,c-diamide synthase [Gammaproteobacteria bacterium]